MILYTREQPQYAVYFNQQYRYGLVVSQSSLGVLNEPTKIDTIHELINKFGAPGTHMGVWCAYELLYATAGEVHFMRIETSPIEALQDLSKTDYIHAEHLAVSLKIRGFGI